MIAKPNEALHQIYIAGKASITTAQQPNNKHHTNRRRYTQNIIIYANIISAPDILPFRSLFLSLFVIRKISFHLLGCRFIFSFYFAMCWLVVQCSYFFFSFVLLFPSTFTSVTQALGLIDFSMPCTPNTPRAL